ncbi:MAG: hypothetical protein PHS92_00225 [Candidatus Gracilibacteria bacterium]|nr:hypothetical protein [Candidatus Gracilibacteria bacterium]
MVNINIVEMNIIGQVNMAVKVVEVVAIFMNIAGAEMIILKKVVENKKLHMNFKTTVAGVK